MRALIHRRPSERSGAVHLLFPFFFNGLFMLVAYAAHALQGNLSSVWMNAAGASGAAVVVLLVADNHFQQNWLRLLRLRVSSEHVQRWVAGHFQMLMFWAGCFCLTVLWIAPLCGFTLQQGSALVGLSMVGWPLYGLAGLARMGHGLRWVRWPWLMYPVSMLAWASSWWGWQYWGKDQGWWLPLMCVFFSVIGLWVLLHRMLRMGEPAPAVEVHRMLRLGKPAPAVEVRVVRRWDVWRRLWSYWRGQGRWIGWRQMVGVALIPLTQSTFWPWLWSDSKLGFRLFAWVLVMVCLLRSDRHHWRWELMPRLRVRQRRAYEIWGATLRFVLSLLVPLGLVGLLVDWSLGGSLQASLQNLGHVSRWWAVELLVATAMAVWVRSLHWRRWQDGVVLLVVVSGFIWMLTDSGRQFWALRHVGHDLLLMLLGAALLFQANRNLERFGLPDWRQISVSGH
jgi:hypothetical protein